MSTIAPEEYIGFELFRNGGVGVGDTFDIWRRKTNGIVVRLSSLDTVVEQLNSSGYVSVNGDENVTGNKTFTGSEGISINSINLNEVVSQYGPKVLNISAGVEIEGLASTTSLEVAGQSVSVAGNNYNWPLSPSTGILEYDTLTSNLKFTSKPSLVNEVANLIDTSAAFTMLGEAVPVGAVSPYYGSGPAPDKWAKADGGTITITDDDDREKYEEIGYLTLGQVAYDAGTYPFDITLPDLRDKVLIGSGGAYAFDTEHSHSQSITSSGEPYLALPLIIKVEKDGSTIFNIDSTNGISLVGRESGANFLDAKGGTISLNVSSDHFEFGSQELRLKSSFFGHDVVALSLVQRDADGKARVNTPIASDPPTTIATKEYVDISVSTSDDPNTIRGFHGANTFDQDNLGTFSPWGNAHIGKDNQVYIDYTSEITGKSAVGYNKSTQVVSHSQCMSVPVGITPEYVKFTQGSANDLLGFGYSAGARIGVVWMVDSEGSLWKGRPHGVAIPDTFFPHPLWDNSYRTNVIWEEFLVGENITKVSSCDSDLAMNVAFITDDGSIWASGYNGTHRNLGMNSADAFATVKTLGPSTSDAISKLPENYIAKEIIWSTSGSKDNETSRGVSATLYAIIGIDGDEDSNEVWTCGPSHGDTGTFETHADGQGGWCPVKNFASTIRFLSSDVSISGVVYTVTTDHGLRDLDQVLLTNEAAPYFVRTISNTEFSLHSSRASYYTNSGFITATASYYDVYSPIKGMTKLRTTHRRGINTLSDKRSATYALVPTGVGSYTAYGWGYNGTGYFTTESASATLPAARRLFLDDPIEDIWMGIDALWLIKNDGTFWSIGKNLRGALGTGDSENRNYWTEVAMPSGSIVKKVFTSPRYYYGLIDDPYPKDSIHIVVERSDGNGQLYTWGYDLHNESGRPRSMWNDTEIANVPTIVPFPEDPLNITEMLVGSNGDFTEYTKFVAKPNGDITLPGKVYVAGNIADLTQNIAFTGSTTQNVNKYPTFTRLK